MLNQHPAKFGDHRHYGSGDIMFLIAGAENSLASIGHYCLFLKYMG